MEMGFGKNWVGLVNMIFDFEIFFIEKGIRYWNDKSMIPKQMDLKSLSLEF